MQDVQESEARRQFWLRRLGLLIIGGVGGLGSLLLLDAVVPGGLPPWFGYLVAGVCFAYVYTQIIRAYIAKRAGRRTGADESTGGEGEPDGR